VCRLCKPKVSPTGKRTANSTFEVMTAVPIWAEAATKSLPEQMPFY
jgi:hypothetical protein